MKKYPFFKYGNTTILLGKISVVKWLINEFCRLCLWMCYKLKLLYKEKNLGDVRTLNGEYEGGKSYQFHESIKNTWSNPIQLHIGIGVDGIDLMRSREFYFNPEITCHHFIDVNHTWCSFNDDVVNYEKSISI